MNARVRAARAWADLTPAQVAAELGMSLRSYTRFESGEKGTVPGLEVRRHIADLCKVPVSFMESGFALVADDGPTLAEEVERLRYQMDTVLGILTERLVGSAPGEVGGAGQGEAAADQ